MSATLLKAMGYELEYNEFTGHHNYLLWKDDIWRGLEWLFGKLKGSNSWAVIFLGEVNNAHRRDELDGCREVSET
jgi:hypothetical protein